MKRIYIPFIFLPFLLFFNTSFTKKDKRIFPECTVESNLQFTENKGQWENFIHFKADLGIGNLFLEDERFTFFFIDPEYLRSRGHEAHESGEKVENKLVNCHAYHINFVNPSGKRKYFPLRKQNHYANYFLGNDPSHWASKVGLYKEVSYSNIFDDIDLRIYGFGNDIKYDFIIKENADVSKIRLEYEGVDDIFIKNDKLHVVTSVNEIIEQKPYAYQIIAGNKIEIPCRYTLEDNIVSYFFPEGYEKSYELIIDPVLIFATYSGSYSDNWGFSATFDALGHLYGAGASFDQGYPVTAGAFQGIYGGGRTDIAITKFSVDGDQLVYSTYLGGANADIPHSLIVNSSGQLVVLGTTSSSNFPTTANAFDPTFNGGTTVSTNSSINFDNGSDIILTVFNSDGTGLIGSTFLGGSGNDGLNLFFPGSMNYGDDSRGEVITDSENNIYIASTTYSSDFPVTSGVFSPNFNFGEKDGCVVKMSFDLSSMIWGTFLGGSQKDAAFSLRIDDDENIFVTGFTQSSNFPTTSGTINENALGGEDGFLVKMNSTASQILAATFLGTNNDDRAYFLDLDNDGNVYVTGQSDGGNYPITSGVYANPNSGQFIHKLTPDLTSTEFSTIFGKGAGDRELSPTAFMVDVCNRIYFSGWGGALIQSSVFNISGMPITTNAIQPTTDGEDFYFIVFKPDAVGVEYASYFGGIISREHVDGGTSRFDKKGTIYQAVCAGCGGYDDFPTTSGAYSTTNNSSNCNLGVIKFDFELPLLIAEAHALPSISGCTPLNVDFLNLSVGATEFFWDFDDGTTSTEETPSHIFTETGNYEVMLVATGSNNCVPTDTTYLTITVLDGDETNSQDLAICAGQELLLTPTFGISGAAYEWQNGLTANTISVNSGGVYWVTTTIYGCSYIDTFYVVESPLSSGSFESFDICEDETLTLTPNTTISEIHTWQDGSTGDSFTTNSSGLYWVVTHVDNCSEIDSFDVNYHNYYSYTDSLDICYGDSILWEGAYYYSDAIDSVFYSTQYGCDSTINLNLTLRYPYFDTTVVENCLGTPYILPDGTVADEEGVFDSYFSTVYGCDSIITTTLSFFPNTSYLEILEDVIKVNLGYSAEITAQTNLITDSITWTPTTYLDCDHCLTVNVTPYHTVVYTASAYDDYGCFIADSVIVYVDFSRTVYIPNVFSPNNDGTNDVFKIYPDKGVKNINYLKIFNRWGDLVYFGTNISPYDLKAGWDGKFNGEELNPAVFVYVTEIEFLNGEVNIFSGDVTLLK